MPKRPRHTKKATHARKLNKTQKREVKAIISRRQELKYWDASSTYFQVDRAGAIVPLCLPARGQGPSDRIGDQVTYKYLDLRVSAYLNYTAVGAVNHALRVMVVKWTDDNTAGLPVLGNFLQNVGGVGDYRAVVSAYAFTSKMSGDFVVLMDRSFSIGEGSSLLAFHRKIKLRGNMNFAGNVTTGTGQLYLIILDDDATGLHTPNVQCQYYSRVTYVDS